MYNTIGILTGGGDAPGLNAVIRAVVTTATGQYDLKVIGIEDGFEGLLGETQTRPLTAADVRGLLPRGGTILGTRNRGKFVERNAEGVVSKPQAVYNEAVENLQRLGIDALVTLGGEGTLAIAAEFDRLGVPVVGVPKTIDNDLACTELTFGFITALDIATDALDRLHTTAESHERVMILEVMGRHTGWIALHSGKETRCVVLGHLQRGGRPNAFDRMLATNYGSCAVRALVEGKRGVMVALQAGDVITVPICEAIANVKTVPAEGQLVRTARDTGISFGAPDEARYHRQI